MVAPDWEAYAEVGCGGGEWGGGPHKSPIKWFFNPVRGLGIGNCTWGLKCIPWEYPYVIAGLTQTTLIAKRELQATDCCQGYSSPSPLTPLTLVFTLEELLAAG